MSGLETVTSTVQDVLIDSLSFTPRPGASYITARRDTRYFAAGSDSYQSDTGVKVIRINLTGAPQEFLDPSSLRFSFDITNRGDGTDVLQPMTGPWALSRPHQDLGDHGRRSSALRPHVPCVFERADP